MPRRVKRSNVCNGSLIAEQKFERNAAFRHTKRLSCPKTALNKIKQLRRGGKGEFFVLSDKRGILHSQNTPFASCHIPISSAIFSLTMFAA